MVARKVFVEVDGVMNPAPAPRFGRTASELRRLPPEPGQHNLEALQDWGVPEAEVQALKRDGVIA